MARYTTKPVVKTTAAERRAELEARWNATALAARAALDAPSNLISDFRAIRAVVYFVEHNPNFTGCPVAFAVRCAEWVKTHEADYELAELELAWETLPERLTKWAATRKETIATFTAKENEAMEKGYSLLQQFAWADKVFTAAAEHDVAMSIVIDVRQLTERGEAPEEGFRMLKQEIDAMCKRYGKSQSRSTSPSSNMAEDATRLAWFAIEEKFDSFRSNHSIW